MTHAGTLFLVATALTTSLQNLLSQHQQMSNNQLTNYPGQICYGLAELDRKNNATTLGRKISS
jgi:hypothetical protein